MVGKHELEERWIVVNGTAALPLLRLDPEAIAEASERAVFWNDKVAIRRQQLLDDVIRHLGLGSSFRQYRAAPHNLKRFLERNKLRVASNMMKTRNHYPPLVHLHSWRDLADRLFTSGRPLPARLFTGYDFDWSPFDRWFYENGRDHYYFYEHCARSDTKEDQMRHVWRWRLNLGSVGCNLLGDALVYPPCGDGFPLLLYYALDVPLSERQHKLRIGRSVIPVLRAQLAAQRRGWLKVVSFSPELLFLRGRGGEYCWMARELRNRPPPSPESHSKLARRDLPQAWLHDLRFEQWLYFRRGVWHQLEMHEAEESFYSAGGTMLNYGDVERRYYTQRGEYQADETNCDQPLPGFQRLRLADGAELYVSQLVTIGEYADFLRDSGYEARRFSEPGYNDLDLANGCDRPELPVACSYYDALAFTAWVEKHRQRPLRLLRIDEYLELHSPERLHPAWENLPRCVSFDNVEYRERVGAGLSHEPRARFQEPLPILHTRGLNFVNAIDFGEWLFESQGDDSAAICAYDLQGIHDHFAVHRDFFPAKSWGKYRRSKIGFRLCYTAASSRRSMPK